MPTSYIQAFPYLFLYITFRKLNAENITYVMDILVMNSGIKSYTCMIENSICIREKRRGKNSMLFIMEFKLVIPVSIRCNLYPDYVKKGCTHDIKNSPADFPNPSNNL